MRQSYERRRALLCDALADIPGVNCLKPEGAFYAWAKIEKDGMDDVQISEYLLDKARVVTVAGSGYGLGSECCVRMCFAISDEEIIEATKRLHAVL